MVAWLFLRTGVDGLLVFLGFGSRIEVAWCLGDAIAFFFWMIYWATDLHRGDVHWANDVLVDFAVVFL